MSNAAPPITAATCVIRGTHKGKGRVRSVAPANAAVRHLHYGRIMAGVTFSKPGNWTSWPPHEHGRLLEEAYLYIDMPAPNWGLQLVFTDSDEPELVAKVSEGDVVVMPEGYHPNVAAPGSSINFLWMMAAHTEVEDRQFGVVNVHPAYAAGGSGLEAAHETK